MLDVDMLIIVAPQLQTQKRTFACVFASVRYASVNRALVLPILRLEKFLKKFAAKKKLFCEKNLESRSPPMKFF